MGNFKCNFQVITAPVLTYMGLSAYWGVSRGGFRGWAPKRFSRARTVSVGFSRNEDFPGQPVWAQPALSNDGPEPTIFGGTAAREFVRMSFDFEDQFLVPTQGYVKSRAIVDKAERVVYYVESENGLLHQADFDLNDNWVEEVNFSVSGEMAITPRSDVLLVADTRGVITAYQVADIPVTEVPSDMPSDGPSMEPTPLPSISMAPILTESPTYHPTIVETTFAPTKMTEAPVAPPTAPVGPVPVSSGSIRSLSIASVSFVVAYILF